jgi:hypothetical protein
MPWNRSAASDSLWATGLASGGGELYVAFKDRILKMPLAGGTASEVYRSAEEIVFPYEFQILQDDTGLVIRDRQRWLRLPYGGGAADMLSVPIPVEAQIISFDPAADTVWAAVHDHSTRQVSIIRARFGAASADTVIAPQPIGYNSRWLRSGDRFFTTQADRDANLMRPMYVALEGGAPMPFMVDPPNYQLISGVTNRSVFYEVDALDFSVGGIYRVSVTGGPSTRMPDTFAMTVVARWQTADALYTLTIESEGYSLVKFSDTQNPRVLALVRTPLGGGPCDLHGVLAHAGYVYTTTFNSRENTTQIWRVRE